MGDELDCAYDQKRIFDPPVEGRDTSAQQGRGLSGLNIRGDPNEGVPANDDVLGVTSVFRNAVDLAVLARSRIAASAALALVAAVAEPARANALPDLPGLFARGNRCNVTDNLVSGNETRSTHGVAAKEKNKKKAMVISSCLWFGAPCRQKAMTSRGSALPSFSSVVRNPCCCSLLP